MTNKTRFHFIWPDLNTRKLGEQESTVRRDTTTRTTRVAGKSYTTLAFSQLTTCLDQATVYKIEKSCYRSFIK